MTDLNPRVLRVPTPGIYETISKAAEEASEGDQIIVAPGTYSVGEKFPIYIPPGCQLVGSGMDSCIIDGSCTQEQRKKMGNTQRPLNPYQSLVLLGDNAAISGVTIRNSCGHGLASEQGARVLITRNKIQENFHHGILIFGTNGTIIHDNHFFDNGKGESRFGGPRREIGLQGHHIYIEGRAGNTNEVTITSNEMKEVFADAIANDMYDQGEGLTMRLHILDNTISGCKRNGMSITSSYDPSNTDVFVDIRNNRILQTKGNAIDLVASYSIVNRSIKGAKVMVNVVQNEIRECANGILAVGAYEAALDAKARYNIVGNIIENATESGIRIVGGYNLNGWAVQDTVVEAVVTGNTISYAGKTGKTPLLIEGGIADKSGAVNHNAVFVHIMENEIIGRRPGEGVVINDGLPTNRVKLLEGSTKPEVAAGS